MAEHKYKHFNPEEHRIDVQMAKIGVNYEGKVYSVLFHDMFGNIIDFWQLNQEVKT